MRKEILKRTFAVVLTLSMLIGLAPKSSLLSLAAGKSANLAPSAALSSNVTSLSDASKNNLHDGNHATALWRDKWPAVNTEKDYYQFDWADAVSVNQISLVAKNAKNQAPVAWHVEVSKDGTTWTKVARITDVQWTGSGTETKTLTFALQENVKGLRVYIDATNYDWNGYSISELEIYNDPNATINSMEETKNLAVSAALSTNLDDSTKTLRLPFINDGAQLTYFYRTGLTTAVKGAIADYYQFDWTDAVSVNQVDMVVLKAKQQAPTAWRVQVTKDGTTWTEVAEVDNVTWQYNDTDLKTETKKLTFDLQENVKGLRVYIDEAHLVYGGYGIQEIEVYNAPVTSEPEGSTPGNSTPEGSAPAEPKVEAPANGNYASVATVTTNVVKEAFTAQYLKRLNDGNLETAIFRIGEIEEIAGKDYYQFNWDGVVSVNQVSLAVVQGLNQAPTAWHIEVSKDGETGWTKVASTSGAKWEYDHNNAKTVETKKLTFALQENIKGLRICIDDANLKWKGYGIQEIEIYNDVNAAVSPKTGDMMPVATIMLALVISVAGITTGALGYRKNKKYI